MDTYLSRLYQDRYYAVLADGSSIWGGTSDEFDDAIRDKDVRRVAFGPDDAYFVLFEDGGYDYSGIPVDLHNKLRSRNRTLPGPAEVSLGPCDESYFIKWKDGKTNWSLWGDVADTIDELHGVVTGVSICSSYRYLVRYRHHDE